MPQPEKMIQNAVLDYLKMRGVLCFPTNNGGVYDPARGCHRKPGKHYMAGVPDILGIYRGYPMAMEVKTETGRVSSPQSAFKKVWVYDGGLYALVRSVTDTERVCHEWDIEIGGPMAAPFAP